MGVRGEVGCFVCHVLRRGETLSEGTLSALMEWLAGPRGQDVEGGGGHADPHIWNHFRSAPGPGRER